MNINFTSISALIFFALTINKDGEFLLVFTETYHICHSVLSLLFSLLLMCCHRLGKNYTELTDEKLSSLNKITRLNYTGRKQQGRWVHDRALKILSSVQF